MCSQQFSYFRPVAKIWADIHKRQRFRCWIFNSNQTVYLPTKTEPSQLQDQHLLFSPGIFATKPERLLEFTILGTNLGRQVGPGVGSCADPEKAADIDNCVFRRIVSTHSGRS